MFVHKTALLSAITTALLASASIQAAEPLKAVGAGEGQLDIVAWPGYIERGESDKAYDWVTGFEKETGCKVNVKTAATSDEMVSLMTKGGYDLVTASGDASLRLIAGKRVQPINTALIPNWKNIDPRLKDGPWYVVDKQTYGTPYQWGPNVLMYNTNVFKTAPTAGVWCSRNRRCRTASPTRAGSRPTTARSTSPMRRSTSRRNSRNWGSRTRTSSTKTQYKAALDLLRKQQPLIHRYWHDATVQMSDVKNEGVVASSTWGYMVNGLVADKQPVASVIPKEGATGWADTTMMHAEAKHPNCAYKWMDWSLQPKVQGDLAAWFGSLPAVPAACKDSELLGAEGCKTNGFDQFDKIAFWKTPQAEGGKFVPYSRWTQDYIAIMGGR